MSLSGPGNDTGHLLRRWGVRRGEFIDLSLGTSLAGRSSALAGHRLGVKWTHPVYQNPNGLQMDREGMTMVAYQYSC